MTVKLEQLRGKTKRRGKIVDDTRPLYRVFLDGDYVGIVGEAPGSKFCPATQDISDEEMQAILGAIGELHNEVATSAVGAPSDEGEAEVGEFGPSDVMLEIVDEDSPTTDEQN